MVWRLIKKAVVFNLFNAIIYAVLIFALGVSITNLYENSLLLLGGIIIGGLVIQGLLIEKVNSWIK